VFVVAVVLLSSCAVDKGWLLTGVRTEDQAEIKVAIRSVTHSPVTGFSRNDDWPATRCHVITADGKIYIAERIHGKWHFEEATIVI
jgi:hypothetical protein